MLCLNHSLLWNSQHLALYIMALSKYLLNSIVKKEGKGNSWNLSNICVLMYLWNFSLKSVTNKLSYSHPSNRHMRYGKSSRWDSSSDIKTEELCKVCKNQVPLFFNTVNRASWSSSTFDSSTDEANISQRKVSAWIRIDNNHQGVKACSSMSLIRTLGEKLHWTVEIHCKKLGKRHFICLHILVHYM